MGLHDLRKDASFAAGVLRGKPFQCLVQLTNRCNMRCSFCDFWPNGVPRKQELTTDDYRRVARELAELGTCIISVEGGEPYLRPDLPEIIHAFSRHHLPTLFTNGWYVTAENARRLFGEGLTHACVSIDFPDAERHDRKRVLEGAFRRALEAIEHFLAAAPRPDRQVHVMSVVMSDNWRDFEDLFAMSERLGVGHQVTLLSVSGYRRGKEGGDELPPPEAAEHLERLWKRYSHVRFFGEYFRKMGSFLRGDEASLPTCRAGEQSFNIDHVGNVSPCIEKIDRVLGNVRDDSVATILGRLGAHRDEIAGCQRCWTACRGLSQALGQGGSPSAWVDLATRMRSS